MALQLCFFSKPCLPKSIASSQMQNAVSKTGLVVSLLCWTFIILYTKDNSLQFGLHSLLWSIIEFISSTWYYLIYFFEHTYLVHHSPDSEKACSLSHTFPKLQTLSGLIHTQASTYSLCNKWLETHLVNTFNFTYAASRHLLQRDLFHRLNEWT